MNYELCTMNYDALILFIYRENLLTTLTTLTTLTLKRPTGFVS